MKALVTGATGFIGSHLIQKIAREGWDLSCIVRESSDVSWIEGTGCRIINGSITDARLLARAVRDRDVVFHLAGLTRAVSPDEYYLVNSDATECVARAAAESCTGLKRFVYLSSLAASGPADFRGSGGNGDIAHPVSHYGRSKLKGEEAVARAMDSIPCTILRPAAVYGPRDREFLMIFRWVSRGVVPSWGHSLMSLVYIDDMINALMLASKAESSAGGRYFIADGNTYSTGDILQEIGAALGRRFVKLRLPQQFLPVIGFFGDEISKIRGIKSMINRDKMRELRYHNWTCDISHARDDLGYNPATTLKKGIRWTAEWYRIHGWL